VARGSRRSSRWRGGTKWRVRRGTTIERVRRPGCSQRTDDPRISRSVQSIERHSWMNVLLHAGQRVGRRDVPEASPMSSETGTGLAATVFPVPDACAAVGYVLGSVWRTATGLRPDRRSRQGPCHDRCRQFKQRNGRMGDSHRIGCSQLRRYERLRLPPQRGQLRRNSALRRSTTGMARDVNYLAVMVELSKGNGWGAPPLSRGFFCPR
jgi:hypothetical protein